MEKYLLNIRFIYRIQGRRFRLIGGYKSMLETAQERIKLLKAGISGNQIEELYILYNNFKVVGNQRPIEKIEINTTINNNIAVCQEATDEIIN